MTPRELEGFSLGAADHGCAARGRGLRSSPPPAAGSPPEPTGVATSLPGPTRPGSARFEPSDPPRGNDNGIGYIFHRQFNLAGADLAAALWLTYLNPRGTMNDVEAASKDPAVREVTDQPRISFQLVLQGV